MSSLESLRKAVGDTDCSFCSSCYTGIYPPEGLQLEVTSFALSPSSSAFGRNRSVEEHAAVEKANGHGILTLPSQPLSLWDRKPLRANRSRLSASA